MSVKTELETISDGGRFEEIATAILRRADSRYSSAIHTGINAEGKPIKDPVDGVGWVQGADPHHFVFLEHTTTKRSRLKDKWLAEPDPDSSQSQGDLLKAAERAEKLRKNFPEADITVALVTNRVVPSDLVEDVLSKANSLNVSVDIWGLHELADFLNNDPDGQWVRNNQFGIDMERLSEPLLLELSSKSVKTYQENFRLDISGPKVQREELSQILTRAGNRDAGSYLLPIVGNSGVGKTTICYQVMTKWKDDGKPTLHLDATDIEDAKSISQGLQSALERLEPSLDANAGSDAIEIATRNNRLLVVIDDLNRADNPAHLFKRIANWVEGVKGSNKSESVGLPVVVLCPLWPRIWGRVERDVEDSRFSTPVELGAFTRENAVEILQSHAEAKNIQIDDKAAENLAESVGLDPHIIGLLSNLIVEEGNVESVPRSAHEVLADYVKHSYDTASDAANNALVPADYGFAVDELSEQLLTNRVFEPAWHQVREWFASRPNDLDAIRELTTQAQLLLLLNKETGEILSHRHDRLRDFLLSKYVIDAVESSSTPNYLNDPYFASVLGQGIAYLQPVGDTLERLRKQNPLALLEAIRELSSEEQVYQRELVREFNNWIDSHEEGAEGLLPSQHGVATNILRETVSPSVLEVTESFLSWPRINLARFRNGDLDSGIRFWQAGFFSPNINNTQRDSLLKEATSEWGEKYTRQLIRILPSLSEEHIEGGLYIAGYLGNAELCEAIDAAWNRYGDENQFLPAFIWAAFECGLPGDKALIDRIFEQWAALPDGNRYENQDESESSSEEQVRKGDVYSEIKSALPRNITGGQVDYLIGAVERFPEIEYKLLLLLREVPEPDAQEKIVRKLGEYHREADEDSYVLTHSFTDPWDPHTIRGESLPSDVKQRMKELWSDEDLTDEVRRIAFGYWAKNADSEDIEELRYLTDTELFSGGAIYHRLRLGDTRIFGAYDFNLIEEKHYIRSFGKAWCQTAYELIDEFLTQESPDEDPRIFDSIGDLMFRIPDSDAESLLEEHWDVVGMNPKFFQAALYTATEKTQKLAEDTYAMADSPRKLLKRVETNFGISEFGRSELITESHLESLQPYLDDIDSHELARIAHKAKELGMSDWSEQFIQSKLERDKRQFAHPMDEDLFDRLDEMAEQDEQERSMYAWVDGFDRRSEPQSRAFDTLREWLPTDPTKTQFKMAASAIKQHGSRAELSILEEPLSTNPDEDLERIYEDAKFAVEVRSLS